jgi:hypothetical protein
VDGRAKALPFYLQRYLGFQKNQIWVFEAGDYRIEKSGSLSTIDYSMVKRKG